MSYVCSEYLATFKKTVAMHEVFLSRLASHPVFRNDQHLKVFLEYDLDLCAKPRKKMDLFGGIVCYDQSQKDESKSYNLIYFRCVV